MAMLLKGGPVAAALTEKTAALTESLVIRGITPTLAVLRVGERPEDLSYERGAMKRCAAAGVAVRSAALPEDVTQETLMETLEDLNQDEAIHGILLLRPLPERLDGEAARQALRPEKDVDGVTDGSLAGVFTGSGQGFAPCTAQAVVVLLDYYGMEMRGKRAVVVGRSLVVGRPAAMLLMERGATVTICHSGTESLPEITRGADILVAAAGCMGMVGPEHLAPGQTVIDVGIHQEPETGALRGDVCFEAAEPLVKALTPVPGGVGAVTSAILAMHTAQAAKRRL
ncbi:MAG: bifunctional 5,10-methylene-tetrahydrofolate dehydrogenase/5,10-methylene-tetrahydrofolate cyclohydrolase [Oscillospiraceae bacterium]|nr:bifunctional 5,10-methylene-tetrahydrofolate dehydrogenase/5,10-methylene-tetrahydrofolate cyclohydrolase [Oscillospiraceae bacterium]